MALGIAIITGSPSPTPIIRGGVLGGIKFRFVTFTGDASYVNGTGYSVTPAQVKLDTVILFMDCGEGLSGFKPVWDLPNKKLRFFKGASGVDVECATNEASLSGAVFDVMVWGY